MNFQTEVSNKESIQNKFKSSPIFKFLQFLFIFLVFFFISRILWINWKDVSEFSWSVKPEYLVVAIFFRFIKLGLTVYCWRYILIKYNSSLSYFRALRIYTHSQLTRYIPGKIWHLVSRSIMAKSEKIEPIVIVASIILELLFFVLSGILIFLFSLFFWKELVTGKWIYFFILLIPLVIFLIYPPVFDYMFNLLARLSKAKTIEFKLSLPSNLVLLILYSVSWLFGGISIFFMIASITKINLIYIPVVTGIISISWVIGFLSFVTPSGLGVREASITAFMSTIFPAHISALISIVVRLFSTLTELFFALLAYFFDFNK